MHDRGLRVINFLWRGWIHSLGRIWHANKTENNTNQHHIFLATQAVWAQHSHSHTPPNRMGALQNLVVCQILLFSNVSFFWSNDFQAAFVFMWWLKTFTRFYKFACWLSRPMCHVEMGYERRKPKSCACRDGCRLNFSEKLCFSNGWRDWILKLARAHKTYVCFGARSFSSSWGNFYM
jgi:hypothetical protein